MISIQHFGLGLTAAPFGGVSHQENLNPQPLGEHWNEKGREGRETDD